MNREDLQFAVRVIAHSHNGPAFSSIVRNSLPADVADALDQFTTEKTSDLLMLLEQELRAGLFAHFPALRQDLLLQALPREAVVDLFERMPSDDRADMFKRLNEDARQRLLPALAKVERDDILKFAAFPEGSIGSVMTSDYATLNPCMTVTEALAMLRSSAPDKETIYEIYVQDAERRLLGTVSLRELVLANPDAVIGELMRADPVFARSKWPREQAAELIRRYDLLALPVVCSDGTMVGIVTVDDAMDIQKDREASQLARFGGTAGRNSPDLDILATPFRKIIGVRVFWLSILTVFGMVISNFVAAQEEMLTQVIILAAFLAPIIDMGGNTGSQSATLVIRSMALGEVTLRWRDVWRVVKRELPIAGVLGLIIAVLELILAYFSKDVGVDILLVVGLSMFVCTAAGGVIGALLPFLARRIGTDPATLSSPLITSIMDIVGVMIYFGFAYAFLSDQLVSAA